MRLRCKIGIHKWKYTPEKYETPQHEELAIPSERGWRQCDYCKKIQVMDRHCLGLNPPQYITYWRTI